MCLFFSTEGFTFPLSYRYKGKTSFTVKLNKTFDVNFLINCEALLMIVFSSYINYYFNISDVV